VSQAIRDYQPEDFDTLWHIDQECFPPGIAYSRRELGAYIRHRATFTLVATGNGRKELKGQKVRDNEVRSNAVQGFIVVHRGVTGHVITIDVKAEARRSGVGSLLLNAAEQRLRQAGCESVGLETAVDNLTALKFYKRHGYSVIRTWPRYYSNGLDAFVLNKELS
jgi:[ribosomal protein S18]-alanine N-acetyltransferase